MMAFGEGNCDHVMISILVKEDRTTAFKAGKCKHVIFFYLVEEEESDDVWSM